MADKIIRKKDRAGNYLLPVTAAEAVFLSNDENLEDAINGLLVVPAIRVYNNANQSVANGAIPLHVVAFNAERHKTVLSMHDNSTNNHKIIAPVNGIYNINLNFAWETSAVGVRIVNVEINETLVIASATIAAVDGQPTFCNLSCDVELSANDEIRTTVYQNSGGALNLLYQAAYCSDLSVHYISRSHL